MKDKTGIRGQKKDTGMIQALFCVNMKLRYFYFDKDVGLSWSF
jgi:hypothetical protein